MKLTPGNLRYLSSVAKTDVMKSHLAAAANLIEQLQFQLEEQTKRHILRMGELEATIRSHGIPVKTFSGGEAHYCTAKETLLDAHAKQVESEDVPCNPHPRAPHGFDRDASHSAGRYVCTCEGWEPSEYDDLNKEIARLSLLCLT